MKLQKKLLSWFEKNARPLPWREHYQPYEVWISEIMLQQTQVETALPYFRRWMRLFPTLQSLAKADEKKVLKAWQGLGYYSRARNLHATSKLILEKFQGIFPSDFEKILSLKGIGRYTAGAIASIAFNQETPIVDGNVLRVLSRVYTISKPIDEEKNKETFWKLEEALIPKGQARFFNQALMELGALVCTAQNPNCRSCPIRTHCQAFKQKNPEAYPVRKKRKKLVKVEASAIVLAKNGRILIQRRPVGEIMGGLWEFPEWKLGREEKLPLNKIKEETIRLLQNQLGIKTEGLDYLKTLKRNYTHHLESLHVFRCGKHVRLTGTNLTCPPEWRRIWVTKDQLKQYPFSSAHAKIAKLIINK